ncbi:MAG TPA: tRNA preQ1(34) S-adenosylmethionine ribosyltransferase-isomerase QueA [Spirochaetota bacterium]|nr:tRNA preQ1(34) S-adenosylmethionine ribosyltransferase-isomerase QueA [Spirochaetota bacterium]HOL56732.1 tRNA preQ1(34) S-adenosylmethionine ribosyltransferase-isomerase QueA [Spirochaetota bacterium]HPP04175.1 tRNA preQ1(34) S-adenosylmethionine ribosyltransferase-isomerase QueA [Spirochaetota bacterium]
MKTELFNFDIPEHLIAQKPSDKRSNSRLLVYYKDKDIIIDSYTRNIIDFLDENYFLIFNNSKVIPARIKIIKKKSNNQGEALLLKIIDKNTIQCLMDKAKRYKNGEVIIFPDGTECYVAEEIEDSIKIIKCDKEIFNYQYFEKFGQIPLPPYIKKYPTEEDKERYQTIYSKYYGSVAAPTAGLHFDNHIFESLKKKSIEYAFVSLHVGLGTFKPIYTEHIEDHKMHTEEYFIEKEEAIKINNAIKNNKIITAIGTTSLRVLESAFIDNEIKEGYNTTDIYIYPPYNFKVVKSIFTNFHTPKSSLIILMAAFVGREKILELYQYAIKKEYRFFSYGDAMLIL